MSLISEHKEQRTTETHSEIKIMCNQYCDNKLSDENVTFICKNVRDEWRNGESDKTQPDCLLSLEPF